MAQETQEVQDQKRRRPNKKTGFDLPIQAVKRNAKGHGIKRIGEEATLYSIEIVEEFMKDLFVQAKKYADSAKRDTVQKEDIKKARDTVLGL